MGNKTSKKSKQYGHSCKLQCFYANRTKQKEQLLISLQQYSTDFFVDIIMEYLPKFEIIKMENSNNNNQYRVYYHSHVMDIYNNEISLCNIFFKSLKQTEFKLVILGDTNTGKSKIVNKCIHNTKFRISLEHNSLDS